jgi:arginine-tRNA-protein transferase
MSIKGVLLHPTIDRCPYLEGMITINENLLIHELDDPDVDDLLSMGLRHFGEVFFRPICAHCRKCIPVRVPVQKFSPTKSVRRLFNRCKHLTIELEEPVPKPVMFDLYKKHKKRFGEKSPGVDSYELFLKSFFHPFSFNKMLTIKDGQKLVAVSHLDVTANAMSAVYCYFDTDYYRYSPGKLAIYKELEMAKEMGVLWYYLGYYIETNKHTKYKIQFKPNQVMADEHQWLDYMDEAGNILNPLPKPSFQLLADYGFGARKG